ncbi:MAG: hypothetical protein IV101_20210 [Dechloromonas sp.]|uniref:hypothetical protein n=1 Tax=Azonexaceae TaxID=2008795 RepID=UPI001CF8F54F|nr:MULTISPECIES: hypothetical protein [Azonexaceae]MBT9523208.1 hypothetical protein [Dechloromonas sp.]UCV21807.1 hypothetical protein KI613_14860 [Ferribacterium limneticum]
MESPKTGLILLALVAITTASGAFLGWTLQPPAVPVEAAKPVADAPVEAPASLKVPAE